VEIGRLARRVTRKSLVGDTGEMYRLAAEGKGVIVSDSFSELRGVRFGETIEIPTPRGLLALPVVGIVRDYTNQQGSMLIDRAVYKHWWSDDAVNIIRVYLKPGVSAAGIKRRILERFSGTRRLFVLENEEVRKEVLRLTDQWFGMTYNQIAVAVLVAVLGIVNTLTVSISDRRRELGVLQAVGGLRRQVRHAVWMEAVAIGVLGLLLGFLLGAVNLFYTLELTHWVAGLRVGYEFPVRIALLLVPAMLFVAFVSALWPAESAVRGSLVEALEYE
jgi:putative ABC transport system permease protein